MKLLRRDPWAPPTRPTRGEVLQISVAREVSRALPTLPLPVIWSAFDLDGLYGTPIDVPEVYDEIHEDLRVLAQSTRVLGGPAQITAILKSLEARVTTEKRQQQAVAIGAGLLFLGSLWWVSRRTTRRASSRRR